MAMSRKPFIIFFAMKTQHTHNTCDMQTAGNHAAAAGAEIIPTGAAAAGLRRRGEFSLEELAAAGNNLTRGLAASGRQMLRLQASMLNSVVAMGFILGEARRLHSGNFKKLFPQKAGEAVRPGMFACSYVTANNYIKTAAAVWQRAEAAGKAAELERQAAAYIADAQAFEAPQREIPVLAELVSTEWVSMTQVMLELGVIKPGKHRRLADGAPAEAPALPGLEELAAQAWNNTAAALGSFRSLMENDIPRLNLRQRHALRDELQGMLAELDRLETAAPALD